MRETLAPAVGKGEQTHKSKFSMRFLRRAAVTGGGILTSAIISACASGSESPTVWNDPSLGGGKSDRGLTSLQMSLDFQHDPAGSIRMKTCFKNNGEFRVVSEEISPRPGYLVDKTYPTKSDECHTKFPVSPINLGDIENVYLGLDDTYGNGDVELSTGVRSYEVTRTGENNLDIKPLSPRNLREPGRLEMRDEN